AAYSFAHGGGVEPRREIAVAATQMWHRLFHRPLRFVAGTPELATAATFYSSDAPSYLMLDNPALPPWVSAEELKRQGAFIVRRASTQACIAQGAQLLGDRPFRATRAFTASHWGRTGAAQSFVLFILPPADMDSLD